MYRNFIQGYREAIPSGLPARLADPDLMAAGKPTFLRIGEGNEPRNELLRVIKQYPSKDEVRTKVLGQMFPPTDTDPYFNRPDNIAAIRSASEELGIPLERTGLRIATNPFRLEGDVTDVNLLAQIINKAAGNLKRSGKPTVANALTRKAQFFAQPRSHSEIAVDGTEGVEAILEAYNKAEPRRTANSQGNRPILVQADGLDPNIGIPSGSPENIPPMDIEGMRGANRFVDVSQGAETARVIQYPNIYDRINKGAQPVVTPTIPYAADLPTGQEFILSPKVSIETKRPRFIDMGYGIYTRSGEPINAEQKNLLDTGMADLEDRSFILSDPATARLEQLNRPKRIATIEGAMGTGSIWQNDNTQYRPSSRLGMEVLGTEMVGNTFLKGRDRLGSKLEFSPVVEVKNLWGTDIPIEDPNRKVVELVQTMIPGEKKYIETKLPINRLTDDLSNRVLSGEVDLRNYEPFKSNRNTYGATQGKTPWREYYSDPFVYEDKGLDSEVSRLVKAVNEAPAQLENALTQQALANRRAIEASNKLKFLGQNQSVRMGLLPQGEGVVNLAREVRKDRRMAEIDAAKANDRIAELKAAQELLGVEYMAKPKTFSPEVLQGYRMASQNKGAIKNQETFDYPSGTVLDPVDYENAMTDMGFAGSRDLWRGEPDRDYDIASLFGFSGNY